MESRISGNNQDSSDLTDSAKRFRKEGWEGPVVTEVHHRQMKLVK